MAIARSRTECKCRNQAKMGPSPTLTPAEIDPGVHLEADVLDPRHGEIRKVRSTRLASPPRTHSRSHHGEQLLPRRAHPPRHRIFLSTLLVKASHPLPSSSLPGM